MFIEKIEISSFGRLNNYSREFEPGLNAILAENGAGKSTITAFIRAMLYGLAPNRNYKTLADAERKKFKPWNGGTFGGSMIVRYRGVSYRIERTFATLEREDTLRVTELETGLITTALGEVPGETMLGISKEGFESTLCLSSDHPASDSTGLKMDGNLGAKVSASLNPDPDMARAKEAVERLTKEIKVLKRSGNRGMIPETRARLTEIETQAEEIKARIRRQKEALEEQIEQEQLRSETEPEEEGFDTSLDEYEDGYEEEDERHERKAGSFRGKLILLAVFSGGIGALLFYFQIGGPAFFVFSGISAFLLAVVFSSIGVHHAVRREEEMKVESAEKRLEERHSRMRDYLAGEARKSKAELNDLKEEYIQKKSELSELEKRYFLLVTTKELLEKAVAQAGAQASRLIARNLNRYLNLFGTGEQIQVEMTGDYTIALRENGILRELDYYSTGKRDLILFAERMAFVDGVFKENRPFLILDDPFTNLDDALTEQALEFLLDQGEDRQVIYLTCQSARMP